MILVCGEALVDLVPASEAIGYHARPGGSPANVATALGRLGVATTLLARLSNDHFGQLIRRHLTESHVDLSLAVTVSERTTVAMVSLGTGGDAGYTFFIEGGADDGWRATGLPALPAEATAVHVSGSLALAVPTMGEAVEALLAREATQRVISFDPNPRPGLTPDVARLRAQLDRWLGYADIIKVSAEDLTWTFPGEDVADLAHGWRQAGASLVVVTRGGDGVYALGPRGPVSLPAPAVRVVDTVGAGDSFTAGLLAALSESGRLSRDGLAGLTTTDLEASLGYAQRVAASTCARPGADPPWPDDPWLLA
jgi:fructokinase